MADDAKKNGGKSVGIAALKARVDELEAQLKELAWYHAELSGKHTQMLKVLTQAAAKEMAAKMRPQIDQALENKLEAQLADALTSGAAFDM